MRRRKFILSFLGLLLLVGSAVGVNLANAQDIQNPHKTIVGRIAQKFSLNEGDVQAVFDEVDDERQAQMKTNLEIRLDKAVSDGKISADQKQAILSKFGLPFERNIKGAEFGGMTKEERRASMETKKTELESWAKENGLSLDTLHEIMGGGKGFGSRGHFMMRP